MRRRPRTPWFQSFKARLRFEFHASGAYPSVRGRRVGHGSKAKYVYTGKISVPGYEPRCVKIVFPALSEVSVPEIFVDGPEASPHRYQGGKLCVWHPDDPEDRRWVPRDGLLGLLDMIAIHLFKEAWWRETGEWLGDEVAHPPSKKAA